jgi:type II secretory pathway pseudopilin PulG
MNIFSHKKGAKHGEWGFTILETLVGISILTLAIAATFSAVQVGLSSSISSRDQVIAFTLAQEAVEYIRNVRDANGLAGVDWMTGISLDSVNDNCYFGNACTVDATIASASAFTKCLGAPGANSCPNILEDSVTGLYGYTAGWAYTNFNREVSITNVSAGKEILITVRMRWTKGTTVKTFVIKESIFNWQ